jgi:hypothetical protein
VPAIDGAIVSRFRALVDDRPARVSEAEQLGDLVVRLAGGVVSRAAQQLVAAAAGHEIQAGVAARDDQHDGRQRQLAILEEQRFDVTGQMMHGHQRHPFRRRQRLRKRQSHEQRPHQSRSLRHGDGVHVVERHAALLERAFDDAADVADVLTRGELRHDAAPLAMNLGLGGDDVGSHSPGMFGRALVVDERGGRLVTRCLDAEEQH